MSGKKIALTKKYVSNVSKIVIPYVIITIFILLFSKYYLHVDIRFSDGIFNILGFEQYSWYVNMYLGLYLLIPFLNRLWNGLDSKKEEKILILVLLILTTLPSVLNTFDFTAYRWWQRPGTIDTLSKFVPDWWANIFPLTYYFIGAYLKKNWKPHTIRPFKLFLAIPVCVALFGLYNFYRSYSVQFVWGAWCAWGGFENVIISVLIFLFLISVSLEKIPEKLKSVITKISTLSFGAYIASWIMDKLVYTRINPKIPTMTDRLWTFFPAVIIVFIGSLFLSFIADEIFVLIKYLIAKRRKPGQPHNIT